jgi:hypothetical protein
MPLTMESRVIEDVCVALEGGLAVPYLGPGMLSLVGDGCPVPSSTEALADKLTAKASVPHKIRKNLSAAAQFIENFKHRKTVKTVMTEAFRSSVQPTELHRFLAQVPHLPLIVQAWYDDLPQKALASRRSWGMAQGVSQAEHFGDWVYHYEPDGTIVPVEASGWDTLLYQPLGSVSPAENFLVSDSDYVEVLTEIDIQTPIPQAVQKLRAGRHFLFLGCRFATQLDRLFARQIMKRSSAKHWAVLPDELTKNEARFLVEQNIERIAMPLSEFAMLLEPTARAAASRFESFANW